MSELKQTLLTAKPKLTEHKLTAVDASVWVRSAKRGQLKAWLASDDAADDAIVTCVANEDGTPVFGSVAEVQDLDVTLYTELVHAVVAANGYAEGN